MYAEKNGNVTNSFAVEVVGEYGLEAPFTIPLSSLAAGSLVSINENGVSVPFYVATHNYESGLNGNGRTLMVRKDAHSIGAWGDCPTGGYNNDNNYLGQLNATDGVMNYWFNNTYINTLDSAVKTLIGSTKFYLNHVYYSSSTLKKGVKTVGYPIFALSLAEYGYTSVSNTYAEGSALAIANTLKIAYMDGAAVRHWTRSAFHNDNQYAAVITADGNYSSANCTYARADYGGAYRPAFTLPATALVNSAGDANGSHKLIV